MSMSMSMPVSMSSVPLRVPGQSVCNKQHYEYKDKAKDFFNFLPLRINHLLHLSLAEFEPPTCKVKAPLGGHCNRVSASDRSACRVSVTFWKAAMTVLRYCASVWSGPLTDSYLESLLLRFCQPFSSGFRVMTPAFCLLVLI